MARREPPTHVEENLAAISAEFHHNSERYEDFYSAMADELGGFPGIWTEMIYYARAFTAAEKAWREKNGEPVGGWIEAIQSYVALVADDPSARLSALARRAINANFESQDIYGDED